jgi:hypothetical protein
MSLTRAVTLLGWLVVVPAFASAQEMEGLGQDRIFADEPDSEEDQRRTDLDGSLTSTTFGYRETGGISPPLVTGGATPDNASPINRLFTDLRMQLDAEHIGGGRWYFRLDSRARVTNKNLGFTADRDPLDDAGGLSNPDDRIQSGRLNGGELELRELYFRRAGDSSEWVFGRQIVLDLAATKIDGVRLSKRSSQHWSYLVFAGLYPTRGSRSFDQDYPRQVAQPGEMTPGGRIMPVTGGLGATYRFGSAYGAFGAVGILPLADDREASSPGAPRQERPRLFFTLNGYWRRSNQLDVYHYIVLDAEGADGAGITNASAGLTYRPVPSLRATLAYHRVDTETLNASAQVELEDPEPGGAGLNVVRNNAVVSRVAQQSLRAGVSVALAQNRFELSVSGQLRQRPELVVPVVDPAGQAVVFPTAQAADITLSLVDRRLFGDFRVGASVTSSFGIGDENLNRTEYKLARLSVSRGFAADRGEYELDLSYLTGSDDGRETACGIEVRTCYGSSRYRNIQLGGTLFYRLRPAWLLVASAGLGQLDLRNTVAAMMEQEQPAILTMHGLLRLVYRF